MSRRSKGETSTRYARPYRPWPVRAANAMGRWGRAVGLRGRRLTADRLLAAAERRTGLSDFGDDHFREPLERLLESVEAEARLTSVGRFITRLRLVGVLANRLRAEALIARHPEIVETPVEAPIIITGLQRTGTTMLHRLLAADPGLRALASWEALHPAPLREPRKGRRDPRLRLAERAERGLAYLAPDFFAIHPVEALSPEEEVLLLDHALLSTVPEATLRVPSYASWLESQDQTPAYQYMKRLLQVLQWQRPGERWVLKTPHHLEWLDTLLQVFPDARLVWTHRDPTRTLASFCSMIAHGRGVFSDAVDPNEVGRHWLAKTGRLVSRAMAVRDHVGDGAFVDVSYDQLVAEPMAQVRRIYAHAGRPLSDDATDAMTAVRQANPQHKYGRHVYRLSDFGLDEEMITEAFATYRARFGYLSSPKRGSTRSAR